MHAHRALEASEPWLLHRQVASRFLSVWFSGYGAVGAVIAISGL